MNDDLGVDFDPQQFDEIQRQAQQMQVDATATNATAGPKEATAPAPQQTNNDVTATDSKPEPKQEEQQQGFDAENYSGFMYGSGTTPNLGEEVSQFANQVAQRIGAAGFGLVDAAVGAYNWLVPGTENDIQRSGILAPFDDKPAQVARDLSAAILPEFMAYGGAVKLLGKAKGALGVYRWLLVVPTLVS